MFIVKENFHALCHFKKNWEGAKNIGFISSWFVKIKFSHWQGKISEIVFDIPEKTEQAKCCILKVINKELSSVKRNTIKIDIKHKTECFGYEEIVCVNASETIDNNITKAEERNKNVVDQ